MIAGVYGMNFEHMPELEMGVRLPVHARFDGGDRRLPVPQFPQGEVAVIRVAHGEGRALPESVYLVDFIIKSSAQYSPPWNSTAGLVPSAKGILNSEA